MTIIQNDPDVLDWTNGVLNPGAPAGDFLQNIAKAARHADHENYLIMRDVLLKLMDKYPQYLREEKARIYGERP
jgi:hypothetical protein